MISTQPQKSDIPSPTRLPKELVRSTIFLLKRLGDAVRERAMAEFAAAGCNAYEHAVLAVLAEGERETQAAIADALDFDRSHLVGILDDLEEQGLVERRRDPNDRRRHVVRLTPEGRKTMAQRRAILKRIENDFLSPLDAESRRELHDLLLRLARHHDGRFAGAAPTRRQSSGSPSE